MTKSKTNCVEEPQTAPQHDAQEVRANAARFGQLVAVAYVGASAVLAILVVATNLGPAAIAFIILTTAGAFAVAAYLARSRDCAAALTTAVGSSVVMAAYAVAVLRASGPAEGVPYAAAAMLAALPYLAVFSMDCPDVV
jgi:hypothetical protein